MQAIAHAKINLALHVRGRRADGYHDIETIFAFVDAGDVLSVRTGQAEDRLQVVGEFADALGGSPVGDNILMQALNAFPRPGADGPDGWHVTLEKNLPVAAGLGGGSADSELGFEFRDEVGGHFRDLSAPLSDHFCVGAGDVFEHPTVQAIREERGDAWLSSGLERFGRVAPAAKAVNDKHQ